MQRTKLEFPNAIAAIGTPQFEAAFLEELDQQSGEISLDDFCLDGGWPDDDTLDFSIESVSSADGNAIVNVYMTFDECHSTGCADIRRTESAYGRFQVELDPRHDTASVVYSDE